MHINKMFVKKIGLCIYGAYVLTSVFCFVARQLLNLAQIPPFLGSFENVWFVAALGMFPSAPPKDKRRQPTKLYKIYVVCSLIGGICILYG